MKTDIVTEIEMRRCRASSEAVRYSEVCIIADESS